MEREFVNSSNLSSIGYDPDTETLEVEFNSGSVYQYYGVSEVLYEELMAAPSHGQFFHAYIRNCFPYDPI